MQGRCVDGVFRARDKLHPAASDAIDGFSIPQESSRNRMKMSLRAYGKNSLVAMAEEVLHGQAGALAVGDGDRRYFPIWNRLIKGDDRQVMRVQICQICA